MTGPAVVRRAVIDGIVTSFSDSVGWGTVTSPDGSEFGFHCVEIADGSRTIAVGTQVTFDVLARFGTWQASRVAPA